MTHHPLEVTIEPVRGFSPMEFGEIWNHRELLYFLVWRDIKVRYKQTVLGVAWAVLQPTLAMAVFSLFFGKLAGIPSDGIPYPIFAFTALVPWTLFSSGLTHASNSLVANQNLLAKIYFPRLLLPAASVLSTSVDFCVALTVLLALMPFFGLALTVRALLIVPLTGLVLLTALGAGLWLSSLNVRFRDVQHVVPFLIQIWFFATPVAYPASLLGEPWRTVYGINPMVGVIEGFRWALLNSDTTLSVMPVSILAAAALLITGVFFFKYEEATFADLV